MYVYVKTEHIISQTTCSKWKLKCVAARRCPAPHAAYTCKANKYKSAKRPRKYSRRCPVCDCQYYARGRADGFGGDAWPMETKALQCGDGSEAVGSLVIWTPPLVPTPSANTERSGSSPNDRNCTRQVAQVVFCLSAKGHDSASQRMQGGVC